MSSLEISANPNIDTVCTEERKTSICTTRVSILLLAFFQFIISRTATPKEPSSEVPISIWINILALLTILVMIFGQGLSQFDQGTFFQYAAPGYWLFLGTLALALVGGIVQMVAIKRWWTGYRLMHS